MGKEVTAPPPLHTQHIAAPKTPSQKTPPPPPEGEEEAAGPQTTQRDGDRRRYRHKDRQTLRYRTDRQTDSQGDGETQLKELKEIRKEKKD